LGYRLPLLGGRLAVEAELGLRSQAVSLILPQGTIHSSILALPVDLSVRERLLELGRLSLDLRLGGGVLPLRDELTADFQHGYTESSVGWEAFAAAQVAWRLAPIELYFELRGTVSAAKNVDLPNTLPGGLLIALGVRQAPR
jgi:hypothetical protein